jgi:hypothetical protein
MAESTLTKQEAAKLISDNVKTIETLIKETKDLAESHGLGFDLRISNGGLMWPAAAGWGSDHLENWYLIGEWYSSSLDC